jgi:hypothetical protein
VRDSRTGYFRLALEYIHLYPFRCEACLTRFYRFRKAPPLAAQASQPQGTFRQAPKS